MSSFKAESLLKPFVGMEDWKEWKNKFERICKYSKVTDDIAKAELVGVLLEGSALRRFQNMPEKSQNSYAEIVKEFESSYELLPQDAQKLYDARQLKVGVEGIDEYYFALVRLYKATLSKDAAQKVDGIEMEFVFQKFLQGLPGDMSKFIKLGGLGPNNVPELLKKARELLADGHGDVVVGRLAMECADQGMVGRVGQKPGRCYHCGDTGHIAPHCKFSERVCYTCKKPGHISWECPQKKNHGQGNAPGVNRSSSQATGSGNPRQ